MEDKLEEIKKLYVATNHAMIEVYSSIIYKYIAEKLIHPFDEVHEVAFGNNDLMLCGIGGGVINSYRNKERYHEAIQAVHNADSPFDDLSVFWSGDSVYEDGYVDRSGNKKPFPDIESIDVKRELIMAIENALSTHKL